MSIGVSTVPAVTARLKAIFEAAVQEPTQVWANRPNEDHDLSENVYLRDVRGEREWRNIAGGEPPKREENYSVAVEVEVYRSGTDGEGTAGRAWEIVLAIEQGIAEDPRLGFESQVQWAIAGRFQSHAQGGTDGWTVTVTFDVQVKARI
jgi:hypothetical protein